MQRTAHLYKHRGKGTLKRMLWPAVLLLLVVAASHIWLGRLNRSNDRQAAFQLDAALRRAAVTCYAVEGRYPESLEALCTRYGVVVDGTRFTVYYDAFGANQMPDIEVWRKGG